MFPCDNIDKTIQMFVIVHLLMIVNCFFDIKIGVISYLLILFVFINSKYNQISTKISYVIYISSCLCSVVSYTYNERPFSIFLNAIGFNVIPTLLFVLGCNYAEKNDIPPQYYVSLLKPPLVLMAIGIMVYIIAPNIYFSYIGVSPDSYTYGIEEYRYGAFVGSLALGSICVSTLALLLNVYTALNIRKKILYILVT